MLGGELVGGETPWWRDDRIPQERQDMAANIVSSYSCGFSVEIHAENFFALRIYFEINPAV